MITNEIIVHGLVQGVGFRWMTKLLAKEMGVMGSVENLNDGTVRIVAQTDPENMKAFIKRVNASPSPSGYVEHLDVTQLNITETLHSFRVTG